MPIVDIGSIQSAGIPASKSMLKYSNTIDQYGNAITPNLSKFSLDYSSLYSIQRHQNMIETFERYMWVNVPFGLTADLIERILYCRGKGVMYFNDKVEKFQFLPFALNNIIDEYGRYVRCNTLPFTGVDTDDSNKKKKTTQDLIYEDLPIVYDLPYNEELVSYVNECKSVGIILNDSSLYVSQQPIIRNNFVKPILHIMCVVMQIINTAIYGSADHNLLQVENESELESINSQINAINNDILNGKRFTAVVGKLPITTIKTSATNDLEGLWNTYNSLSNLLKSITGVANPGVFDKKAHLLQDEQQLNGSNADDIYYNGLRLRQEFCLLFQAYYNYPIWCESKRGMTEAQSANISNEEKNNADNTQQNNFNGGESNGESK